MHDFKVFYINLERNTDRKIHMEKLLSSLGFSYERIEAVDGSKINLSSYYDNEVAIYKNGASMTPAEVGCAASHREIYRRMVKENIPYVLVFEDDIETTDNFKSIVTESVNTNRIHKKWDYLSFDYAPAGNIFLKRWILSTSIFYNRHIINLGVTGKTKFFILSFVKFLFILPMTYFESWRDYCYRRVGIGRATQFLRPLYFAGCYLLTQEAAQKLLSLAEPKIVYPADRLPNRARILTGLRFRAYVPLSAFQKRSTFGSNIDLDASFQNHKDKPYDK